jgi:hypothetical protein
MAAVVISGNSKKDIQLLITIAEKMGLKTGVLTKDNVKTLVWLKP